MSLPRLGGLWMLVAGLFFACMGVFVKLGGKHFSGGEMVFYRSLFGALAVFALVRANKLAAYSAHWRVHVARSLAGLAGMLLFHVIGVLPLSTVGAGAFSLVVGGFHPFGFDGFAILLGLGICATLGQLAMTRAYQEGDTLTVGSLAYSTVVSRRCSASSSGAKQSLFKAGSRWVSSSRAASWPPE